MEDTILTDILTSRLMPGMANIRHGNSNVWGGNTIVKKGELVDNEQPYTN